MNLFRSTRTTPITTNSMSRESFPLILLAFAAFALSRTAQAQDGNENNSNTAEGQGALHTYIATANGSFGDTAIGFGTLFSNTTGNFNTATGVSALSSNTTGNDNTATGVDALQHNTTASDNTATGASALSSNTTGSDNTATGVGALPFNTTGSDNTATGASVLTFNTTGSDNTATGVEALRSNNADFNTATGGFALNKNTSGVSNTATGLEALFNNTTGGDNTATGVTALFSNTTGSKNTADGVDSLEQNTTGTNNTAEGHGALIKNTTGGNNTALGYLAGQSLTTGSNNIDIGANVLGNAGEANTIRIGIQGTQAATYVAGIYSKGIASATGVNVKIDSTGKLGTVLSSARYKEAIKPMDKSSESILQLKPITFRYKKEFDPDGVRQFGLVAEEVEKVCPDLVVKDEEGKPLTVRYDAVNAMLLNEFLREHRKVEKLEQQIDTLTAAVQKMSKEIETNKPALHVADNDQ